MSNKLFQPLKDKWIRGWSGKLIEFLKTVYLTFLRPWTTFKYQAQFTIIFTPRRINKIKPILSE